MIRIGLRLHLAGIVGYTAFLAFFAFFNPSRNACASSGVLVRVERPAAKSSSARAI